MHWMVIHCLVVVQQYRIGMRPLVGITMDCISTVQETMTHHSSLNIIRYPLVSRISSRHYKAVCFAGTILGSDGSFQAAVNHDKLVTSVVTWGCRGVRV